MNFIQIDAHPETENNEETIYGLTDEGEIFIWTPIEGWEKLPLPKEMD